MTDEQGSKRVYRASFIGRASLEEENRRLREALEFLASTAELGEPFMDDLDMPRGAIRENLRTAIKLAKAALAGKSGEAGNG